jgi:hypothetical protein
MTRILCTTSTLWNSVWLDWTILSVLTNVSEEHDGPILFYPQDGGRALLRNVDRLQDVTLQQSPPWEPQISQCRTVSVQCVPPKSVAVQQDVRWHIRFIFQRQSVVGRRLIKILNICWCLVTRTEKSIITQRHVTVWNCGKAPICEKNTNKLKLFLLWN